MGVPRSSISSDSNLLAYVAVTPPTVAIQLNGEPRQLPAGLTVAELVERVGRNPQAVAVELNGEVLNRSRLEEVEVRDGDRIEIVQFVQGGGLALAPTD